MITDITNKEIKLRTRSQLGLKKEKLTFNENNESLSENAVQLNNYREHWEALRDLRNRFIRNVDFLRGRQLDKYITNDAGETVTEAEYISEQGKTPFVQNIIRPVLKSIEGLFRQDMGQSVVVSRKPNSAGVERVLTNALQSVLSANEIREVDPRTLDYFMLSGLPAQRIGFDMIDHLERYDVVIDYIDPNYLFFNSDIKDIRGNDLRLIGQLHDLTIDDLFVHFAKSEKDKEILREKYPGMNVQAINYNNLSKQRVRSLDFYIPLETHKCRVIEVWEKKAVDVIEYHDEADASEGFWEGSIEQLEELAQERFRYYTEELGVEIDEVPRIHHKFTVAYRWFYKFITPSGFVLREGISPYKGYIHPFVLGPYPLISGEVWGLVEDLLDIQEQYNRMFTHMDFLLGTSAKNTLVLDEASLNGQDPADISDEYRRVGGVIVLKLKDGAKLPFELQTKGIDRAIFEIIQMFTKLMQDISGVQPSLQGQKAGSGVPASRFIAEAQNSTLNLKGTLDFFSSFRKKRDMKVLKMIIQFYKTKRYLAISGSGTNEEKLYDPEVIGDSAKDLDLVISKGTDSPVYKAMNDEMLKEFVMANLIPLKMFLKHTDFPFSKSLLEDLQNTEEQVGNGEQTPEQGINNINGLLQENMKQAG